MQIRQFIGFTGLSLAALFAGCGEEGADDAAEASSAVMASNALSVNALSANALSANALSANALSANALTATALRDPLAREFLKYVVSCALPASEKLTVAVDGRSYTFPGSLGLAPQWGGEAGSCDVSCQRWVSGCVLARVDFAGIERPISLRGDHAKLRATAVELRDYTTREATYYGNVFGEGQKRYLCLAPGLTSNDRVCGPSLDNCPMKVMGSCSEVCERPGRQGSFTDCALDRDGSASRTHQVPTMSETVTVFLPR